MTYNDKQKELHHQFLKHWDSAVDAHRYDKETWRKLDTKFHEALQDNDFSRAAHLVRVAEQLAVNQGVVKALSNDSRIMWTKTSEHITEYHSWNRQIVREYTLPNGNTKKAFVTKSGDYSVGMPLTPEGNIVLCREYRPGPDKIMLDMPGGALNKGEDPKVAMARELLEETGYAGEVEFVNTTLVNPYSVQRRHTFVIKNCKRVSEQKTDHDEFIEVVEMPLGKFVEYVLGGNTTNSAATFFCLNYLGIMKCSL